jgi:hypothetical protein
VEVGSSTNVIVEYVLGFLSLLSMYALMPKYSFNGTAIPKPVGIPINTANFLVLIFPLNTLEMSLGDALLSLFPDHVLILR